MRHARLLTVGVPQVLAVAALAALSACAQLVDFPDVSGEGGAPDTGMPHTEAGADARVDGHTDATAADAGKDSTVVDANGADSQAPDAGTDVVAPTDTGASDALADAGSWGDAEVLAISENQPAGLVLVGTTLYWADQGDSTIRTLPPDADGGLDPVSGPTAVAYTLPVAPHDLLTDGVALFARATVTPQGYYPTGLVLPVPPQTQAAPYVPVADGVITTAIAVDRNGGYLLGGYSDNHGCNTATSTAFQVDRVTTQGGTNYTCDPSSTAVDPTITALSYQGGTLFIGTANGPILQQSGAQMAGSTPTYQPMTVATYQVTSMVSDSTALYFTTADGNVMAVPHGQGASAAITLASGQDSPALLVTDGSDLYWTNTGSGQANGSVCTIPVGLSPSTPVTIASNQATPYGLAIDALHTPKTVYWTSTGAGTVSRSRHL